MSTVSANGRATRVLPPIARLGFDGGRLLMNGTFLNFQLPVLLVDRQYIGNPSDLGLRSLAHATPSVRYRSHVPPSWWLAGMSVSGRSTQNDRHSWPRTGSKR